MRNLVTHVDYSLLKVASQKKLTEVGFPDWKHASGKHDVLASHDKCGIAEENRPTGTKFLMEIIDW